MTHTRKHTAIAVAGAIGLAVLTGFLGAAFSDSSRESERQRVLEQGASHGDMAAIRQLYDGNFYVGADSKAEVALWGAAWGDWKFQQIYFEYWQSKIPPIERTERLRVRRNSLTGPMAKCYLHMLEREKLSRHCQPPVLS